jgi:hypothetical protein
MTEPTADPKPRADVTRAYIPDPADLIAEFRTKGEVTGVLRAYDAEASVRDRHALENMIQSRLHGASIADIMSGKAIPARTPPAGRTRTDPAVSIIIELRAKELYAAASKAAGSIPPAARKELLAQTLRDAATEVATLTPAQIKQAKEHSEVRARLAAAKGIGGSLGDLFRAPAPSADPDIGAQFEALAHNLFAGEIARELGGELEAAD